MPLNKSSSGLGGASFIVINIDPDMHFIRTVGSCADEVAEEEVPAK